MKKHLKLLIMLLLIIVPTIFSACGNTYKNIEIVASSLNGEQNVSMFVGEEKEITFNVYKLPNNASGRLNFSKDSNAISQPEIVSYNKENHKTVIKFKAESHGRAEIKAIAEGNKFITIIVFVKEKVASFELKQELVLVEGDESRTKIDLNSKLFNFYPKETEQTELEFLNQNNEIITSVALEDYLNQTTIQIKARSPYLDHTKDVVINVIKKIAPFKFYVVNEGEEDSTEIISKEEKTDESQSSTIYLSANKKEEYSFVKLQAEIDGKNDLYGAGFVFSANSKVLVRFDDTMREYDEENDKTLFNFVVSIGGFDTGEEEVVFEAFYTNVNKNVYKITRTFKAVVLEYPNKVFVNNMDSESLDSIILHVGYHREITTNVNVNIYPLNAKIDSIEISKVEGQEISDYIEFKQNGKMIDDENLNLSLPIVAKGIQNTNGEVYLVLKIYYGKSFEDSQFEEIKIPFEVKAGASTIHIEDDWSDSKIYVSLNKADTSKNFEGLYVTEMSAYLDEVQAKPLFTQGSQTVRVEPQKEIINEKSNKKILPLKFYPLAAGETVYNIILANGVSKQITIIVLPEIEEFKINYVASESSPVTSAKYENQNLTELSMQIQEQAGVKTIKTQFSFSTGIENYLEKYSNYYKFEVETELSSTYNVVYYESTKILSVDGLDDNGLSNKKLITIKLSLQKIENFKLVPSLLEEENQIPDFEKTITFNAFLPLSSISFSKKQLSLFNESELGIYYKGEASDTTKLEFLPSGVGNIFNNITPNDTSDPNKKIEYSVSNASSSYDTNTKTLKIGEVDENGNASIGIYNIESGEFTLDDKSLSLEAFDVIAKVTYYGKVFVSTFKVTPKRYMRPTSIQFSDYVGGIYLDATRPRAEINMFMLPNNVTHKVIEYDIEGSPSFDISALSVQIIDNTKLIVSYNSNIHLSEGASNKAEIVLKPRASIDSAAITPTNSRRIKIEIGLGTSKSPLNIYTAEQFMNISSVGLDKHYKIVNKIDLSHITNFKSLGVFTGSIVGEDASSEISGIKITSITDGNAGLFTRIESQRDDQNKIIGNTGLIKNLKISGNIDITLSSASNVGLVAGELGSGATLENVSVTLLTSNVTVSTEAVVYIGGVVGQNKGTIQTIITNQDKQYSSLLVGLGRMTIDYTLENVVDRSFVGGVVGLNDETALIEKNIKEEGVSLYNAGNYFVSLDLLITSSSQTPISKFSIGTMAGKNTGTIKSVKEIEGEDKRDLDDYIKLGGKITIENQSENIVGGIVGENAITSTVGGRLDGIISRVKMFSSGAGTSSAYFGGLFGKNDGGTIMNLILQAIEDGTSVGFEASMLFSKEFGNKAEENRIGVFGYDTFLNKQITIAENYNNLQAQTFVGAENNDNVPSSRRKLVLRNEPATLTNYYGDFVIGQILPQTDEEIDVDENSRTAIKFTPAETTFLIDENDIKNQMISAKTPTILMAYLSLFKAKDVEDQTHIEIERLNNYNFPFGTMGEIGLFSLNPNIVSILNDGTLKANNVGMTEIQVYSMLNKRVVRTVYIMVTHYFSDYNLYLDNKIEAAFNVHANYTIQINTSADRSLLPVITASTEVGGYIIYLVPSSNIMFENVENYEDFTQTVVFEKVGGTYVLRAVNKPGNTTFDLQARVFYNLNGNLFVTKNPEDKKIEFSATYYVGATKVSLSSSSLEIEPLEKTDLILEIETDKFEDDIEIEQYNKAFEKIDQYFNIKEKNRLYNISLNKTINEIKELEEYLDDNLQAKLKITQKDKNNNPNEKTIDININLSNLTLSLTDSNYQSDIWLDMGATFFIDQNQTYSYKFQAFIVNEEDEEVAITSLFKLNKIQKLYSIEFNEEEIDGKNEYVGNYTLEFMVIADSVLSEKIGTELSVKINAQTIGIVSVASFEGSQEGEIASGKPEYNYVDPMAKNKNHFRISMFPLKADYDYIRIDTGNNPSTSNQINAIFTLIDVNGLSVTGAKNVSNGLIVDKNLIKSDIYIKYSIEMLNLYNEDNVPFIISVYKNNQVIYTVSKTIKVKYRQDVSISIIGKSEDADGNIYVTRGSTYNFNLTAEGYRDSEVVIQTLTSNVITTSISSRTLTIASDINVYQEDNLKVTLRVFGRKTVNGEIIESFPQEIKLVVVDYLILQSDEHIPVKRASNKIASVAIGDTLVLEAEFVLGQTVEYQPSITSILSTIRAFENTITQQGFWKYQMGVLNSSGVYDFTNQEWKTISGDVSTALTDGYFTISKNNKSNRYVFTPHKVIDNNNAPYRLAFEFGYDYKNGKAVLSNALNVKLNIFFINVYQMSAIDSPTPIYTTAQLQALNPGSYYILMNDIVLTSSFTPISTAIGGLDGNNKKIIINSGIELGEEGEFAGLFTTISKNTLIRNLNIEVANVTITVAKQNSQSYYFGLLAGLNNGMITNVSVKSLADTNLRVQFVEVAEAQSPAINYASLLVGNNSATGTITHSRVEASIYSDASISGFVAYNRGKISSSYVNNSLILNTSGRLENKTAGFVVVNAGQDGDGGRIISSYVSGVSTGNVIYSNNLSKAIQSSREVGGFVYENSGYILNSYSNIPILASSTSAGFVYTNYGIIENTFSTSLLKETSEGSYGFIKTNYGTLKNNYYLSDLGINDRINSSNIYEEGSSTNMYQKTQLLQLKIAQFFDEKNFVSYVFAPSGSVTKGVWFYPSMRTEPELNNPTKNFTIRRPELLSANLLATSEMDIDVERTIENTQTGEVDYAYKNVGEFYQGSTYNPIIITSAQDLESRILQSSSGTVNTNSFRLVADLDYGQNTVSSSLYRTIFAGELEGNGMEIKNYVVNISNSMENAGLFAKIGLGSSGQGTVKNLVLKPAYINLPNTNNVGALAGTVDGASLFHINVDGQSASTSNIMIVGKNLVGGLFGRAIGKFTLKNITSNISVSATFRSSVSLDPKLIHSEQKIGSYFLFRTHTADTLSKLSYSGAVGGVLAGDGTASYINVQGNIVSNSEWASLMFGGVGNGVLVKNSSVVINQFQIVQSSAYSGAVASEFYGKMENVTAIADSTISTNELFKTLIYKPYGVGGIVGLLGTEENLDEAYSSKAYEGNGGLYNVKASIDINTPNVQVVGGIVARMLGGKIDNATFNGVIFSRLTAGGVVGEVGPPNAIDSTNIKNDAPIGLNKKVLETGRQDSIISNVTVDGRNGKNSGLIRVENDSGLMANVGGIVGVFKTLINDTNTYKISNATVNSQIRVLSISYGATFLGIYVGGIIGNVEVNSENKLHLENLSFTNRMVINLKNLNFSGEEDAFNETKIKYGYFVGMIKDFEVVIDEGKIESSGLTNIIDQKIYLGEVSKDNAHYFLFSYIKSGETKQKGEILNEEDKIFRQTTLING